MELSPLAQTILTIIASVLTCSGLWALIQTLVVNKQTKDTAERKALLALLHDRIYTEAKVRIKEGRVSTEDYDNLRYLYEPYKALGGNGTCERLMNEVDRLPIKEEEK